MSVPYIPLYVADYEADTSHLTLEEDGAYMRLLRLCWRTPGCSIPDKAEWIARRMRVTLDEYERVISPLIDEFFQRSKGRVFSPRLQEEHNRICATKKLRSDAGKKGGRPPKPLKKAEISKSPAKAKQKHPEPEPDVDTEPNVSVVARDARTPLPDGWLPDQSSIEVATTELRMTDREVSDAVDEFADYWRSQARTKAGKKTPRGWQQAFRNRLRELSKRWGTQYRKDQANDPSTRQANTDRHRGAFHRALQTLDGSAGDDGGPGFEDGYDPPRLAVAGRS